MMNADDVRALVRNVLAELVTPAPRRALVLFTGALIGFEKTIPELAMLRDEGVGLRVIQTPSAERILDQDLIAGLGMAAADKQLTASHDMLIVPTLTQNVAAKTAHGVADCLASNLMNDYLLAGKPVVVASSGCDPDDPDKQRWFGSIPEGYAQMMRGNLCTLRSFGVRTARAGALARTVLAAYERLEHERTSPITRACGMSRHELLRVLGVRRSAGEPTTQSTPGKEAVREPAQPAQAAGAVVVQQRLISQRVVQRLPEGTVLKVPATAMITAMAQDIAGARAITIVREA